MKKALVAVAALLIASLLLVGNALALTAYYRDKTYTGTEQQVKEQAWRDFGFDENGNSIYAICDYKYLGKTSRIYNVAIHDELRQYKLDKYGVDIDATPTPAPTALTKPQATAASAGYTSIRVSWGEVPGAMGYWVYRASSKSGKFIFVTSLFSTDFTDHDKVTGKTYYYKVRADGLVDDDSVIGPFSSVVSARAVPAKPTSVKASRVSNSTIKLSWKKVAGATKYQVYRATSKTGTFKKAAETGSANYTSKKLTNNKTYYYKVRAYHVEAGKRIYGSFSGVVNAKP